MVDLWEWLLSEPTTKSIRFFITVYFALYSLTIDLSWACKLSLSLFSFNVQTSISPLVWVNCSNLVFASISWTSLTIILACPEKASLSDGYILLSFFRDHSVSFILVFMECSLAFRRDYYWLHWASRLLKLFSASDVCLVVWVALLIFNAPILTGELLDAAWAIVFGGKASVAAVDSSITPAGEANFGV